MARSRIVVSLRINTDIPRLTQLQNKLQSETVTFFKCAQIKVFRAGTKARRQKVAEEYHWATTCGEAFTLLSIML